MNRKNLEPDGPFECGALNPTEGGGLRDRAGYFVAYPVRRTTTIPPVAHGGDALARSGACRRSVADTGPASWAMITNWTRSRASGSDRSRVSTSRSRSVMPVNSRVARARFEAGAV